MSAEEPIQILEEEGSDWDCTEPEAKLGQGADQARGQPKTELLQASNQQTSPKWEKPKTELLHSSKQQTAPKEGKLQLVGPHQRWVGPEFQETLRKQRERLDGRCPICRYKCNTPQKQTEHIRQHFSRMFCGCGFSATGLYGIAKHKKESWWQHDPEVYEVDQTHYPSWVKYMGIPNPPPFKKC